MQRAFILDGLRSYIGIENSMYRHVPAEVLGAKVLQKTIEKCGLAYEDIDMVIAGNAVGAGGNIARLMTLEAGVPYYVPAFTVDLQCGSGLESMIMAAEKIKSGSADVIIAGGFESSSTAPRRGYHKNHPDFERYGGENNWYKVAKFVPGEHEPMAMLQGAERAALSEHITRHDLDKWVLMSHEKAKYARDNDLLRDVIVQIQDGCDKDEGIRDRMSQKLLDRLPFVLKDGQVITAANACLTNDGASMLVICSEEFLKKHHLQPKAEIITSAHMGTNPMESPKSACAAIDKLLEKNGMKYGDIDIYECNEAFAVIDELFARKYPKIIENDRYNIFGGALAYGHPYGASGGIITLHAIRAMEIRNAEYAVCSVAAAGGIGTAMLIRREK